MPSVPAALLTLLLAVPGRAQTLVDRPGAGRPPEAAVAASTAALAGAQAAGGKIHSLRKLLDLAWPMAREWSQGAKLYSAYGRGPRSDEHWEPQTWGLLFGDPKTRDGYFHVEFQDGAVRSREGVKGGVKLVEQFKEGKLDARDASPARWRPDDYLRCRPVHAEFVDTSLLEKTIKDRGLPPDSKGLYGFSLFRAVDERCDGLGRQGLFLREKPLGYKLLKRSLWAVHTLDGVVYIDARTGRVVYARSYSR